MQRNSSIELLRLVAMLMVVNLHSFWGDVHGSGMLQVLDFFRESASICAVNVFVLISGYFGIKWKLKSFYNLTFQVLFYSFFVYLACVAIGIEEYSHKGLLSQSMGLFKHYGFIRSYIMLWFLAPILNAFADNVTAKKLFLYTIILWIGEIFVFNDTVNNFSLIYLVGRFVNKTNAVTSFKLNVHKAYWIITVLICACSYGLYLLFNLSSEKIQSANLLIGWAYSAPMVILQAVFLFLIFARWDIKSRFINWCSSSCLAIFLIHMHPSLKFVYYDFTASLYSYPPSTCFHSDSCLYSGICRINMCG